MGRALTGTVYVYFGLAVAHWWSVHQLLDAPPGRLWCGNVISDPLAYLLNQIGPIVAGCGVAFVCRRIPARQRPLLPARFLPLLLGTTAALLFEARWLSNEYGLPLHRIWWFPWL
jgi:hypothetical protein